MRRQRWEFLARVACVLGGGFLLFSLGEIAQLLDVWPSPYYRQAKEAYDALQEQQRILAEELNPIEKLQNSDAALERAKAQTLDATRLQPGLILVCKKDYTLVLIDRAGKKRHEWRMPPSQIWPNPTHTPNPPNDAAVRCTSAHVYPNGDVVALFHGIGQTPYGFGLAKIDSDAKLIWKYSETTHHNLYVARNGDIYTLVHHFLKEPAKGLEHLNYPVLMDSIDILSPEGQLKRRISLMEAFQGTP